MNTRHTTSAVVLALIGGLIGTIALARVATVPHSVPAQPSRIYYTTPTPTPTPTATPTPTFTPTAVPPASTPTPTPAPTLAYAPTGPLDLDAVYAAAGVPGEWVEPLKAIAGCESRGNANAVGDSGRSLGLHQLWVGWFAPGEDPFDPVVNAKVAVRVRETRGHFGGPGGWTCADILGIP